MTDIDKKGENATYYYTCMSCREILCLRADCIILGETEKSYKIRLLNWHEDSPEIKWVGKKRIEIKE